MKSCIHGKYLKKPHPGELGVLERQRAAGAVYYWPIWLLQSEKREPIELVLATADVLSEGAEGAGGERELFKFSLTTLSI